MQTPSEAKQGLSLKTVSILTMAVSLVITFALLITGIHTFRSFSNMEKSTDNYITLSEAANELMSASDFLTEEVQCYTVMGDRVHLDRYFEEADVSRRREHALLTMKETLPDSSAMEELKQGLTGSVSLMDREFYAMRLMMEALGDQEMPEKVKSVALAEDDKALSAEKKISLARSMVHDETYYAQKNRIRTNLDRCIDALKEETYGTQKQMETKARSDLVWLIVLVLAQCAAVVTMMWMTTHLGVNPVLQAVDHIKKDQKLPIIGAAEFRYLAGTYNVMYNAYKKSVANLSFKASHDDLTGVYNRAGYDLIRSSLDMSSTALMIFDADEFKSINDRYGHEAGDRALKKIAGVLKKSFRSDDYICRIGGDEFVVFMVHASDNFEQLITQKVIRINEELNREADGLPRITLSAGVSFRPEVTDPEERFRQADLALYYVKEHGRDGCCFYSDALKGKTKPPA